MRRALPLPSASRKSKGHKRKPSVDKAFLELGRRHFAEDFPNPTRQGCPQDDVLRLLAEQPTQGRRFSSGSHHLVFTVLHDLQWLPPADESKKLQPKVANPIPQTTKSVKNQKVAFCW